MQYAIFSVIIPLYNKEKDIEETLNSVINQSFRDFEIIVINDGSTDGSLEIVKKIINPKLKVYSIANGGASFARNYGVKLALGDYVAFLDADDYWYPYHLDNLKKLITNYPYMNWYATGYEFMESKRRIFPMNAPPMKRKDGWVDGVCNYFENSMSDSLALTSAVCMKKNFFHQLGGFNVDLDTGHDIDLWIKAGIETDLVFSNVISMRYNMLGSNRITEMPIESKRHMEMESYIAIEKKNLSLRKFLAFYRYSHAIKFKLYGSNEKAKKYEKDIDLSLINAKQRFLLKLSPCTLRILQLIKDFISCFGYRIRASK